MYSIWLQNSIHNDKVYNLIQRYAKEEKKDSAVFDKVSIGSTYFQKLYLESSDNSYFFNAVSNIEGWPSLWVPHMSLCYGDELPKSFDLGELNQLIPITISFDTLSLYKTGPKVSEWKEITTLLLD